MEILVQVVHVIVSITLILFILLQTGKGSDLGAVLGGGGSNTLFGATGATTFLSKLTTYAAVIFVVTCMTLAYMAAHPSTAMKGGESIITEDAPAAAPAKAGETKSVEGAAATDAKVAVPVKTETEKTE
jgi:preprotein translocase subunit SecG